MGGWCPPFPTCLLHIPRGSRHRSLNPNQPELTVRTLQRLGYTRSYGGTGPEIENTKLPLALFWVPKPPLLLCSRGLAKVRFTSQIPLQILQAPELLCYVLKKHMVWMDLRSTWNPVLCSPRSRSWGRQLYAPKVMLWGLVPGILLAPAVVDSELQDGLESGRLLCSFHMQNYSHHRDIERFW